MCADCKCPYFLTVNRTNVELKLEDVNGMFAIAYSVNRTNVELKSAGFATIKGLFRNC